MRENKRQKKRNLLVFKNFHPRYKNIRKLFINKQRSTRIPNPRVTLVSSIPGTGVSNLTPPNTGKQKLKEEIGIGIGIVLGRVIHKPFTNLIKEGKVRSENYIQRRLLDNYDKHLLVVFSFTFELTVFTSGR